ncbi:hypothetical protein L1987_70104 [Smallanthus sonchifolius]|uniref:Uncharacterized protein n=1 Tax=Smallanthus sonchifolius TaxID=185202 RepID=A0ACB9ASY7_9ASTR|nr:hypothetical protein L1987_70104 [Smallanthus sonchifolius]
MGLIRALRLLLLSVWTVVSIKVIELHIDIVWTILVRKYYRLLLILVYLLIYRHFSIWRKSQEEIATVQGRVG